MTVLTAPPHAPAWSARPFGDADRAAVLDFFTEPGFYFRTAEPDTLSEASVVALVGDAHVLLADGEPVGLYAVEWPPQGRDHYSHLHLSFRLRGSAPAGWWPSAYREIVRALRWRRDVVRLAVVYAEFDAGGVAAAGAIGLVDEGTLADVVSHGGERAAQRWYSQVWPC